MKSHNFLLLSHDTITVSDTQKQLLHVGNSANEILSGFVVVVKKKYFDQSAQMERNGTSTRIKTDPKF